MKREERNQNIKIALVLPSLSGGGMERVMTELAIYFAEEKKAEVHLILLSYQDKFYKLPQSISIHEPPFKYNNANPLLSSIKTMLFFRQLVKKISPSCILSFGEMYNSFVLISAVFTNYNVFVSDRSKPDRNWGWLHHLLRNIFYKRAKGIISQTEFARKVMEKRLRHTNITVIGNPIRMSNPISQTDKKNIILSVGRMIKSKRFDLLINIFNRSSNQEWQLHLVGDGPERPNLELLVKSLNLETKVTFLGFNANIDEIYSHAKIFAFTSNSEGFPNALGEAMSANIAPISFDFIAGASDLIKNNENGFLIEMDNERGYIDKLNLLMHDEALLNRLAKAAGKSIQKFRSKTIAEEYYQFLLS